ncbi:MAG: methyltransferase domain-containing protein [Chitinophagales bacterium]
MKIWIAKAIIQKAISFLPNKHKINYLFQRYVTKGVVLSDSLMEGKLGHCRDHLIYLKKYGNSKPGFSTLEIGTGWYPIVPFAFYLAGAENIYTIDISDLLKTSAVHETILKLRKWYDSGQLETYLPGLQLERFKKLETLLAMNIHPHKILEEVGIHTILGDARNTPFSNGQFDLINSNNTFEHIPPEILLPILKEFKRVLKPDGLMSHSIDMSDHFAHLDKSITVYNFLQFSDSEWNRIDNSIQPQNRLRITDYRKLYEQAGFKILEEINRPGSVEQLRKVKLDGKYSGYTEADVAVTHTLILAEKAG